MKIVPLHFEMTEEMRNCRNFIDEKTEICTEMWWKLLSTLPNPPPFYEWVPHWNWKYDKENDKYITTVTAKCELIRGTILNPYSPED